jgi:TRAP-type C4-dicarboxylate transport system substrate-binding protein
MTLWKAIVAAAFAGGLILQSQAADAARVLKLNESLGPGSPEEDALQFFKKTVEERSKGELQLNLFFQDSLGGPQVSLENLMTGSLDLYSGALEYYQPLAPDELGVISIPYLFTDHDHLQRYLKSDVFAEARQKMLSRGIRFLSTDFAAARGPYRVIAATKPIKTLADLDGLKVRVIPNDILIKAWRYLGAVPVQVPWTQTYLGLRQGVVQGATLPLSVLRAAKFTEVAPNVTAIREFPQEWPITISERVWNRLSGDLQKILVDATNEASVVYSNATLRHAAEDVDVMKRDDHAVFGEMDPGPLRAKLDTFFKSLIADGTLSQRVFDKVKALEKASPDSEGQR